MTALPYARGLAVGVDEINRRNGVRTVWNNATTDNVRRLAECLTSGSPKWGVLLLGGTGNGKTTLMRAFQYTHNAICALHYYDSPEGKCVMPGFTIATAREIADAAKGRPSDYESYFRKPLLGIDDLGTEPGEVYHFKNLIRPVAELLEYRYQQKLFTFVTTNLRNKRPLTADGEPDTEQPEGIAERYGERVLDRLREMMHVIPFRNGSYRK